MVTTWIKVSCCVHGARVLLILIRENVGPEWRPMPHCEHEGHYTNFSVDSENGGWRLFDDVRVSSASDEDVLSSQAFLLVYTNSSTLSGVKFR